IEFYKNIGTTSVPSFSLRTNMFGLVNVKGDPNLFGTDGYASPFFYDEPGGTKLLVGSVSGQIFQYSIPQLTSDTCIANLIDNNTNAINEGAQSTVFYEDINGDNKRDLFVGNAGGGLSYFSSTSPYVSINELQENKNSLVSVYPVPAHEQLSIQIAKIEAVKVTVIVYDIVGKEIKTVSFNSNHGLIDLEELNDGVYFARILFTNGLENYTVIKKIIKN
ncbi:MAG: T9SS type A sorting domain-containing protein, partial [Bacteroidia bacterium]